MVSRLQRFLYNPTTGEMSKNFSWTLIGNVFYAACQWLRLVAIAKLGTPDLVGRFTLGLAISGPIVILINLGLRSIQATDHKDQFVFGDYFSLRITTSVLGIIIFLIIAFMGGYTFQDAVIIFILGLSKIIESIAEVFYAYQQKYEKMKNIAISQMLKAFLSVVFTYLFMALFKDIFWGIFFSLVTSLIVLNYFDLKNCKNIYQTLVNTELYKKFFIPHWDFSVGRRLLFLALPLGITSALISFNSNIPNYFIQRYFSVKELGFYSSLAYILTAGSLVVNALGQSSITRMSKYLANGEKRKYFNLVIFGCIGFLFLGILGIIIASFWGKEIITLVYTSQYAQYTYEFRLLMVSGTVQFIASYLTYSLTACRIFKAQLWITTVVLITTFFACFIFVPTLGIIGAIISTTISYFIQIIIEAFLILRYLIMDIK